MTYNKLSKFRKDIGIATIASMMSFAISLVLAPIMTRWYEPADYGTFALINNIAVFIATAILFSLPNAIPMELSWHRRAQLLRALIHLALFAFIISSMSVLIFVGFGSIDVVFLWLPLLVLAVSVHRIAQGWANADGAFSSMAAARVAHPLIAKPFAIIASMLTVSSPIYLVVFEVVGYFVQAYMMLRKRFSKLKGIGDFLSKRRIKTTLGIIRRHHDYSLFLNFVNLLTLAFIMMQTVIIALNYSVTETGLFALAMSMASLPMQLIAMATASIIYHKLIHITANNPEQLFQKTVIILIGYMLLGAVPYLLIFFFGSELFGFIFGSEWTESGTVASILALPLFLQFISMPILSVFRVTKTIKLQFIIDITFILPMLIGFYIVSCSMPFLFALKVLAIAISFYQVSLLGLVLYVAWNATMISKKL